MASCLLSRVAREEAETQRLTYVPRTASQKENNQTEEALEAAVPTPSRLPQCSTRPDPVTWDGGALERVKEGPHSKSDKKKPQKRHLTLEINSL